MSKVTHRDIRQEMVRTCRAMNRSGINQGTSGNLSHRVPEGLLITPSGMPYDDMGAKDIVAMAPDGTCEGRNPPSSEWRFHRDIIVRRPEVNVVLHTHSPYATTLAVHGRGIPAFHYMVAVAGGHDVRCSPYACFGTQELSDHALAALDGRTACLLGHHGMIVLADNLEQALWRAVEIETLAKMYVHALAIGEPPRLSAAQMDEVLARFRERGYGAGAAMKPEKPASSDTGTAPAGKTEARTAAAASATPAPTARRPARSPATARIAAPPATARPQSGKPRRSKLQPASSPASAPPAQSAPAKPAASPKGRSAATKPAATKPAAAVPAAYGARPTPHPRQARAPAPNLPPAAQAAGRLRQHPPRPQPPLTPPPSHVTVW